MNHTPLVRRATLADAGAMARLHSEEVSEGFLALLGQPFLHRLYRRVVAGAGGGFAMVSLDAQGLVDGFVAVAESTGDLYRSFLVRDGLWAGLRAAPAVARHPRQVIETLRHGIGSDPTRRGAEVLALAVASTSRGSGRGAALVSAAVAALRNSGVTAAHVVTASSNEAARRTYERCGFRPETTIEVHRGVVQEVFVWH